MRAAVLMAARTVRTETVPVPRPGPREVLVRVVAAGVCHTDVSAYLGRRSLSLPMVLGHEGAGIVEEVGEGVDHLAPGDHVVLSIIVSCGECAACRAGRYSICPVGRDSVFSGVMPDGTTRLSLGGGRLHHFFCQSSFAEFAVVPARSAVRIRAEMPLTVAATLGCGAMTGIGAVIRRAAVPAGASVVVVGCGGVGLAALMAARLCGAEPIVGSDPVASKRDAALRVGAVEAVEPADLQEKVMVATGGASADYVFDTVGSPDTLRAAIGACADGGTVVAIGVSSPDATVTVPVLELIREKWVTGTYGGSISPWDDIPQAVDWYLQGRVPLDELIARQYPLEDVTSALEAAAAGADLRGVVTPGRRVHQ